MHLRNHCNRSITTLALAVALGALWPAAAEAQIIRFQDFENPPGTPTWNYTQHNFLLSINGGVDGSRDIYTNGGGLSSIIFESVDTSGFTDIQLDLRLRGRFIDLLDAFGVLVSTDNGQTYTQELAVTGKWVNVSWNYEPNTKLGSTSYGAQVLPDIFLSGAGSEGYSFLRLTDLPSTENLVIKFLAYNNDCLEALGIDNITLSAIPEPSTYAAIFGAITLGVVVLRRRLAAR